MLTSRQRRARKRLAEKIRRLPHDEPVRWQVWELLRQERERFERQSAMTADLGALTLEAV